MRHQDEDPCNIGFGFGGDANCGDAQWSTARFKTPTFSLHYKDPSYLYGKHRKGGDLMIGCSATGKNRLIFFENTCEVAGREKQHDPMIMAWHYKLSKSEDRCCFSFLVGAIVHAKKLWC